MVDAGGLDVPHATQWLWLAALLADSEQVRQCMSEQVFRYTYGRRPTAADAGLHQIHARSEQHGGAITELMVGALLSDGFRYRDPEPEAP